MNALKSIIMIVMLMACTVEMAQPDGINEPGSYPENFSATPQSNTSILVTWEDESEASPYLVQAKTGAGSFATVIDGSSVADEADWSDNNAVTNVARGVRKVMFTGLAASTTYDFVIHPYNTGATPNPDYKTDGVAPTSNATTSNIVVEEPAAHVTGFKAVAISNSSIKLTWVDASKSDKYVVLAKTGEGSFVPVTDGDSVVDDMDWSNNNGAMNVNQSVQEVIFSDLTEKTRYDFTIYPYNEGGDPDPNFKTDGDVSTASTSTGTDEPLAHVTSFAATALSNNSVKVSWTDASDVDKYVVLAKTGEGSFVPVTDGTPVVDDIDWSNNNGALNVNQSVQEVVFSGLTENTSYDFTIYPYSEGGDPNPNFKTDGTLPTGNATTTNEGPSTFDESLVTMTHITVSGTPFDITTDDNASKAYAQTYNTFSYIPQIVMVPSSNGGSEIGWYDNSTSSVKITKLNNDDTKNGADLKLGKDIKALGGFAKNGAEYVYGYVSGENLEKYTVSIVNSEGAVKASTVLTGEDPLEDIWSKQSPLFFGSGRIVIDDVNQQIGVFISHRMTWSDGLKHQAGLLKFLNFSGDILGGGSSLYGGNDDAGGSNWLYSHNFDTRLVANDGKFTLAGNGDAYPRAIPFRIMANGNITENQKLFEIDGSKGDNDTRTQLGGLVALDDGNNILTFSTAVGRNTRDVNFMRVGSDANLQAQVWLTNYTSDAGGYAINVKSARYGDNFVVAWEETSTASALAFKAMFAIVSADGDIIKAPQQFSNIRFNRGDDFINYANGDVGWAIGSGSTLKVYRLKLIDL